MTNTTTRLRSPQATDDTAFGTAVFSAEAIVLAISGITGLWEADYGLTETDGWWWQSKTRPLRAQPLYVTTPKLVTGSNTRPALQFSYGRSEYTSTERGAVWLPTFDYLGSDGFTVIQALRVPTIPSGETGGSTVGGYAWAAALPTGMGIADNTVPRLNISGSTGKPVFSAGGKQIANPSGDLRDGLWHVVATAFDKNEGTIKVRVDGSQVGTVFAATTAVPSECKQLSVGIFQYAAPSPFYGQIAGMATFNVALGNSDLSAIETYFINKYNP